MGLLFNDAEFFRAIGTRRGDLEYSLSIRLDFEDRESIEAMAEDLGVSKGDIVRYAVACLFQEKTA